VLAFEARGAEQGFDRYAEALWWTAMLITTVGYASRISAVNPRGRIRQFLQSTWAARMTTLAGARVPNCEAHHKNPGAYVRYLVGEARRGRNLTTGLRECPSALCSDRT
jgi:hypothetical protein